MSSALYEWVSTAFPRQWQPLTARGGERWDSRASGRESSFAWEEPLRPIARVDRGNIRIQQEVTCQVAHSSLFSSGKWERERGRSREKEGARGVEVNGPSSSLILAVWDHRAAECVGICLTSENETEQDGGRDTEGEEQEGGQKDTGGKGRREGGGGDLEEFWDLLWSTFRKGSSWQSVSQGLSYSPALELLQPLHCSRDKMNYLVSVCVYVCACVCVCVCVCEREREREREGDQCVRAKSLTLWPSLSFFFWGGRIPPFCWFPAGSVYVFVCLCCGEGFKVIKDIVVQKQILLLFSEFSEIKIFGHLLLSCYVYKYLKVEVLYANNVTTMKTMCWQNN